MNKFDFTRGLMFFMVVTSWFSAGYCSKWFGLAGSRIPGPHATRSQFCILVEDLKSQHTISTELVELCDPK